MKIINTNNKFDKLLKAIISLLIILTISIPVYFHQQFTILEKEITFYEILSIFVTVSSTVVSFIIAIVVYYQTQKSNDLEATNYSIFLGVDRIDENIHFGDEHVFVDTAYNDNEPKKACVSVMESTEKLSMCLNVSQNCGEEIINIPLIFTTRNKPLITTLTFKKTTIELSYISPEDNSKVENVFNNVNIHRILKDESEFVLFVLIDKIKKKD